MRLSLLFTTILVVSFTRISIAQKSDSTIYFKYQKISNLKSVKYKEKKHFLSKKLKQEGWLVTEYPSANSEIIKIDDYHRFTEVTHRFGLWKSYYRNGAIKRIDSIGTVKTEITKEYYYNRNGDLELISISKPKLEYVNGREIKRTLGDIEYLETKFYSKGLVTHEFMWLNGDIKHGKWKYYENGVLKKIEVYDNGVLKETRIVTI